MTTPPAAIPNIGRETVFVDKRTILLDRPADSNKLLDDPSIQQANVRDDYMPYWADIWPASRMMAKIMLREPWDRFPLRQGDKIEALELGCGLGLAGIAGLMSGLRVVFSDYDLTALKFAERNARLNGFTDFKVMPLDWRSPPEDFRVPVILAADLTYELRNIDPLLALIKKILLPGGVCFLTDPDRTPAPKLRERLAEEKLPYSTQFIRAGEPGGERTKGTLYRIQNSANFGLS
ncbi:MAG: methyltransferase domain-containing protein [Planctomycetes bacterium]|nr:methyltransferase domain-containing protein [Planctomycetota bacterium]